MRLIHVAALWLFEQSCSTSDADRCMGNATQDDISLSFLQARAGRLPSKRSADIEVDAGTAATAATCSFIGPEEVPAGQQALDCWRPAKACVALFTEAGSRHMGCVYQANKLVPSCSLDEVNVGRWADCDPIPCAPAVPAAVTLAAAATGIAFPLQTSGRFIVDSDGYRVKWACVNWYGAHMKQYTTNGLDMRSAEDIANTIKGFGFNCVRLPYSVEGYMLNPAVRPEYITRSSGGTSSRTWLSVFDEVVLALTKQGIMVILNNHNSDPIWCCSMQDGNGLWFNERYSEDNWLVSLWGLSFRYRNNPLVVGHDTRNEVRISTVSGKTGVPFWVVGSTLDEPGKLAYSLRAASERAADVVLQAAGGNQLVVIEPPGGVYLCAAQALLAPLTTPCLGNRLVWSVHDYEWFALSQAVSDAFCSLDFRALFQEVTKLPPVPSYPEFKRVRDTVYGHLALGFLPHPLWIGEFGAGAETTPWWNSFVKYCQENDFDFAYWPVDGYAYPAAATSFGDDAVGHGQDESYGLLEQDYLTVRHPWKLQVLQGLKAPREGKLRAR